MRIRVYTTMNYIDIETKDNINIEDISTQLDLGNVVGIETIDNTTIYLNNLNVVAIEIADNTPPIEK